MISEMEGATDPRISGSSVDVVAATAFLWRKKLVIAAFVALALAGAIIYLNVTRYTYSAAMLVAPPQTSTNSNQSRSLGSLGSLAAMAGVNLSPGAESGSFLLYLEALHAYDTAADLARDQSILRAVFPNEWNAQAQRWEQPKSIASSIKQRLFRLLGLPIEQWHAPNATRLQEYLVEAVEITEDPQTGIVTVGYNHEDQGFTRRLLSNLHRSIDERLQTKSLARATSYIRHLEGVLSTVTVAEHRLALMSTLSEQEKMRMMASSPAPFAAEIVDGPVVSLNPTRPKPMLILVASLLAGLVLGITAVVLVENVRRLKHR